MNYTEELGLKLPELDESFDLEGHWNYNTEKLDAFAAATNTAVGTLESGLSAAQSQIAALQGGVHLKGSVNYYSDLPEDPDDGDAYTVLYFGTSGQEPAGIEYAWVNNSQSWIPIGVDPAAFAKPADITAAIAALDVAEAGGAGKYISAISEKDGKIEATPATFDTALSSSSTDGNAPTSKAVFDDQQRQEVEIGVVANAGAKNFLNPNLKSKTVDGVTYTLQSDGRIIANGTAASASLVASFYGGQFTIPAGDWLLNGCPSGGSTASYMVQIKDNSHPENPADGTVLYRDFGTGDVLISISTETTFMYVIRVVNGYTANNVMFKPMIRPASITDSTFQPYALPNPILTSALIEQVDSGAKNLCNVDDFPTTTAAWRQTTLGDGVTLPAGEYILSFTNITSNADGTLMQIIFAKDISFTETTSDYYHITKGTNTSKKFRLTGDTSAIRIYAGSSYADSQGKSLSFSGLMICSVEDYAVSPKFVPRRPSWQEMTDNNKIIDISSQITAESGYTVESTTHLYYQNKQVFGTIAIAINNGSYSSSLTAIAKLPVEYAPARQYLGSCGFSTDQWAITNIGYAFIQAANASSTAQRGQISVKSPTANLTHMILNVCYPVQIDEVLAVT